MRLIDLSLPLFDGAPAMPADPVLSAEAYSTLETGDYRLTRLTLSTHQGTHIDLPSHVLAQGATVTDLTLDRFVTPAFVADCTGKQPGQELIPEDLAPYTPLLAQGVSPVLCTGWDAVWGTPGYFTDFPCVGRALADFLAEQPIRLLGMDTPSPHDRDWKHIHQRLLSCGILLLESLAAVRSLPFGQPFVLLALPLKLRGLDGSPVRAAAMLDDDIQ